MKSWIQEQDEIMLKNFRKEVDEYWENFWGRYFKHLDTMSEKEFVWTDELVFQFAEYRRKVNQTSVIHDAISTFKHYAKSNGLLDSPKETIYPKGILAFKYIPRDNKGNVAYCLDAKTTYQEWVSAHINTPPCEIYSVRNSSNETLTVGDETNYGKLEFINIYCGRLATMFSESTGLVNKWIDEVHPKQVLKTTDEYELELMDRFYSVTDSFEIATSNFTGNNIVAGRSFKNEYNAIKWIEENKPIFSKKQLREYSDYMPDDRYILIDRTKLLGL